MEAREDIIRSKKQSLIMRFDFKRPDAVRDLLESSTPSKLKNAYLHFSKLRLAADDAGVSEAAEKAFTLIRSADNVYPGHC